MAFPGAHAHIIYNDAGEPIGWDYPSDEREDPFDDRTNDDLYDGEDDD